METLNGNAFLFRFYGDVAMETSLCCYCNDSIEGTL